MARRVTHYARGCVCVVYQTFKWHTHDSALLTCRELPHTSLSNERERERARARARDRESERERVRARGGRGAVLTAERTGGGFIYNQQVTVGR